MDAREKEMVEQAADSMLIICDNNLDIAIKALRRAFNRSNTKVIDGRAAHQTPQERNENAKRIEADYAFARRHD